MLCSSSSLPLIPAIACAVSSAISCFVVALSCHAMLCYGTWYARRCGDAYRRRRRPAHRLPGAVGLDGQVIRDGSRVATHANIIRHVAVLRSVMSCSKYDNDNADGSVLSVSEQSVTASFTSLPSVQTVSDASIYIIYYTPASSAATQLQLNSLPPHHHCHRRRRRRRLAAYSMRAALPPASL